MSRYFCHEHLDVLTLATRIVGARPGAALLGETPFHPGGGGQLRTTGRKTNWRRSRCYYFTIRSPQEVSD
jgi:Ser-tRNA(Ala) deacylase AlaX